ncbi:MAG: hypothetical protein ACR2JO_07805 [Mycobacteriales bacterium]
MTTTATTTTHPVIAVLAKHATDAGLLARAETTSVPAGRSNRKLAAKLDTALGACAARQVLHLVPADYAVVCEAAISTAEAFTRGEATAEECGDAKDATKRESWSRIGAPVGADREAVIAAQVAVESGEHGGSNALGTNAAVYASAAASGAGLDMDTILAATLAEYDRVMA